LCGTRGVIGQKKTLNGSEGISLHPATFGSRQAKKSPTVKGRQTAPTLARAGRAKKNRGIGKGKLKRKQEEE